MTTNPSRKRKRVSKNKKKNWRSTDIQDVEEFVEDKRLEERTGGPASAKTDDDLFFVDKEVDDEKPEPAKKSKREPRPLKCHAILELKSAIDPVKIPHNIPTLQGIERRTSSRVLQSQKQNKVSKKKEKAEEDRQLSKTLRKQRIQAKRSARIASRDLWADDETADSDKIDNFHKQYTKKSTPKVPSHYTKKPSSVNAVIPALPGQSYNPSFDDHQALILEAAIVEQEKEDANKKIHRALDQKFPDKSQAPTEQSYLNEMSVGLFESEEPRPEFTAEELDKHSINPPVRREDKKTEKQRRKQKERREEESKRRLAKQEKQKKNEYFRIKSINKEVKKRETELQERAEKKAELVEEKKDQPKRLGKFKYEEPSLEVKLSDELEGSLRQLTPEGNLLHDRYKSLQKRNILEPRQLHKKKDKRKKKTKWAEKKGHKEITA